MTYLEKLPKADRRAIAEKVMELGNIAAGSLLFTQIFVESFKILVVLSGGIVLALTYPAAILFLKGG